MSGETKEHPTHPFTQEQIAKWTVEGHWPLPPGTALMGRAKSDPKRVKAILETVQARCAELPISKKAARVMQKIIDDFES